MGRNPFEYGRELDRDELVDREEELAELETTIRNCGRLFLIGPRRFGKTSLLHACAVEAERQGILVLRFDFEKYESLPLLAQALLSAATRRMKGPLDRTLRLILEAASRLRPSVSADPQGMISVTLDTSVEAELPVLTEALDTVEVLAGKLDHPVVVMLDEIQALVIDHGLQAEKQLRATVQSHKHICYIFAGSATRLLTEMTTDPNRPFYRMGARYFLGPVPREAFLSFLQASFASAGFQAEQPGLEAILDSAEDVPYNVQRLAYEAWEMMRSGEITSLSVRSVQEAVERIVTKEDPAYSQIWTQLTKNQKKALSAVVKHGGEGLQSRRTISPLGLSASSMQSALEALVAAHLIRSVGEHGIRIYRLVDPFMKTWLARVQVQ